MSYVIPNSQVQLFKGVPLNKDSEDTLLFRSVSEQEEFFSQTLSATFSASNFTFIKKEKQTLRIASGYSEVYQCNYMRFNNTQSGNKWFYAFITDIVYINEETTEIEYEIDVMQTWLPNIDYKLTECYVDREHSATDEFGDNVIDEGLALGDFIEEQCGEDEYYSRYLAFMLSAVDFTLPLIQTVNFNYIYDKTPCGYILVLFDLTNEDSYKTIATFISDADLKDGIMGCYTIPEGLLSPSDMTAIEFETTTHSYNLVYISSMNVTPQTIYVPLFDTSIKQIDGYPVKNNKLFTYPYNRLLVTNSKGHQEVYKYELFQESEEYAGTVEFVRYASMTPPCTACIIPKNYADRKGGASNLDKGYKVKNKMCLSISAIGGYSGSLYESNLMQQLPSVLSTVAGVAGAGVTGGASLALAVQGGANLVGQLSQKDAVATKNSNPDNVDMANNLVSFDFYRQTITADNAKRIDDFFSAYGYKTDRVKVPNINVRLRWTYTKTSGANHLSINVPASDMKKINEIFDRGVRFHKYRYAIGQTSIFANEPQPQTE